MKCPKCNKKMEWIGAQGFLSEYKCNKCKEYFYFDENNELVFLPEYKGWSSVKEALELNPKLFKGEELKPEVKDKLLEIVDKFKESLKEDEVDLDIKDVELVGSNVGYNYTKNSDLDLHIIADVTKFDEDDLVEKLYNAYRRLFNDKYDISIYGIPVEIYVEGWKDEI